MSREKDKLIIPDPNLKRIAEATERIADAVERLVTLMERLLEDGLPGRR